MNIFESAAAQIRHSRLLGKNQGLWDAVRPVYNSAVSLLGRRGLKRNINGTDAVLVAPECRGLSETYEPEFWKHLLSSLRPGDTFVDVGSYWGIYAIAAAKRIGAAGRVIAFEPDPANAKLLRNNVKVNGLSARVTVIDSAVSDRDGEVSFRADKSMESGVCAAGTLNALTVRCVCLDSVIGQLKVDIAKIDVEGFEEKVLMGAARLLRDPRRRPGRIYIEVHPFAWPSAGTTSHSLITLLEDYGYDVRTLQGERVETISEYGNVLAIARIQ